MIVGDSMNYSETKILETERLILRKIKESDAEEAFKNWTNDPKTARYVMWDPHGNVEVTKELFKMWEEEYKEPYTYKWVVYVKKIDTIIGTIDVVHKNLRDKTCEIGYCYGSKYWNNGYGTEALKAVLEFLFNEVGFELIEIHYQEENIASGRVMQKAGLKYETTLRSRLIDKETGNRANLVVYSLTKEEFNSK